jgi:protein ImuB
MLEQIVARAAERALAIAYVETSLVLDSTSRMEHRRVVRPALPECSHHTLLKLIQLDLEMHPPQAAVIGLYMQAQPARPQAGQQGLFVPQTPEAGQLEVLLARLRKMLGEDRVGAPELLDSHRPDAFRLIPFVPNPGAVPHAASGIHTSALRLLRPPQAVRVEMEGSRIVTFVLDGKKLPVHKASGPWKTSGAWWTHSDWCREEWDVTLGVQERLHCRVALDPRAHCWYLTGIYD